MADYVPHPHVKRLVDIFGATDGGVELVIFKTRYEDIVRMADEGDEDARYYVNLMRQAITFINAFAKD